MSRLSFFSIWLLALAAISVFASSGDNDSRFQTCIVQEAAECDTLQLSLPLRITRWTCLDDCKYRCMHEITDRAIEYGEPVQQYYGKWPFWRLLGMQEPASVLFSLMNFYGHFEGARLVRKSIPSNHPMRWYILLWSTAGMNAWVWSAVFHTRDLPWTEKLDYFSAALAVGVALYNAVIRLFHLYPQVERPRLTASSSNDPYAIIRHVWTLVCVVVYIAHVSYLSVPPRFDYTYNMIFNLCLGVAHNILWCLYFLPSAFTVIQRFQSTSLPRTYRPSYASKGAIIVLLTTSAVLLEVLDFAPFLRVIDAHSLWHLVTVPLIIPWYNFLVQDALDDGWKLSRL